MKRYLVSDGIDSEIIRADSPREAAEIFFDGYEWAEAFLPTRDYCVTADTLYSVYDAITGEHYLTGPQSDFFPWPDCVYCAKPASIAPSRDKWLTDDDGNTVCDTCAEEE